MAVYVTKKPLWMKWISSEEFRDDDLYRIITFFVFHSPCAELSSMSRTLKEYGWISPWKKPYWLNRQLKQISTNPKLLFSAHSYDAMEQALEKAQLKDDFPFDVGTERICIYDNMKNQFLSVFYHIRNAFAHCRIKMIEVEGDCIFVLEDVVHRKGEKLQKVSARMILRKSTLIKWIELIQGEPSEYKTYVNDRRNSEKGEVR